ncbi:hypothetical protein ACOMHN_024611 [Nucella lapillus]
MPGLTAFQEEKLNYYFKFFKPNEANELDRNSLRNFMDRVLEFTGWDPNSADARATYEVHENFFETLFDKTSEGEQTCTVSLEDWMSVWRNLLPGCKSSGNFPVWLRLLPRQLFRALDRDSQYSKSSGNFPVWLRLLPRQLFRAMDRDKDGKITEEELFNFYHYMVKLPYDEARTNSKLAYDQMTDGGKYPLNLDGYGQIFANFLLGGTPYGPGRFIFGCFEHSVPTTPFRLIQPAPEPDDFDMDVKLYLEKRPKRMSISSLAS